MPILYESDGTSWIAAGTGSPGPTGPAGATGPAGPGVPVGGSTGQVLTKNTSTNYDTSWQTPAAGGGSGNLDGGSPSSVYGGTSPIDGGTP